MTQYIIQRAGYWSYPRVGTQIAIFSFKDSKNPKEKVFKVWEDLEKTHHFTDAIKTLISHREEDPEKEYRMVLLLDGGIDL